MWFDEEFAIRNKNFHQVNKMPKLIVWFLQTLPHYNKISEFLDKFVFCDADIMMHKIIILTMHIIEQEA